MAPPQKKRKVSSQAIEYEQRLSDHANKYLSQAIDLANHLMQTDDFKSGMNKLKHPKSNDYKFGEIRIVFSEMDNAGGDSSFAHAWTKVEKDANMIYINHAWSSKVTSVSEDTEEYNAIIFFLAVCIIHELGHLVLRWQGITQTPPKYDEAGYFLEQRIFSKTFDVLIQPAAGTLENTEDLVAKGTLSGIVSKKREIYEKLSSERINEFITDPAVLIFPMSPERDITTDEMAIAGMIVMKSVDEKCTHIPKELPEGCVIVPGKCRKRPFHSVTFVS